MKVTLLGNYAHDEQESMRRYAEMLKGLLEQKGWRVEILRPTPVFGRLKRSGQGLGKWLGYIDKFIIFPLMLEGHLRRQKAVRKDEPFLVHICDHSNAMYTRWLRRMPHLVTCHDVLAIQSAHGLIPNHKTKWTGRLLQKAILTGLKQASYVICVSDETRNDLLALAPELKDRSETIENALNYPFTPMPVDQSDRHLSRLGVRETPFLFHVGGDQWYKNREGVISIFSRLCASRPDLAVKLVMAGKPPTEAMRQLVEQESLTGKVIFTGTVTNEELCALYSRAEALVFPSLREGFGWPIIEAQACGCPVVTSNLPPMNRLAGPVALLADPASPDEFVRQLRDLLSQDPAARLQRKLGAQRHASGYDTPTFLNALLQAYDRVL